MIKQRYIPLFNINFNIILKNTNNFKIIPDGWMDEPDEGWIDIEPDEETKIIVE